MNSDSLSIGIDFGTTDSRMAWYDSEASKAEIPLSDHDEAKRPSLVCESILGGKPAEELLEDGGRSYGTSTGIASWVACQSCQS